VGIKLSSRRSFRAELETPDGPAEVVVIYRPLNAAERNSFRSAVASNGAMSAAVNPDDKAALAGFMASDLPGMIFNHSIAATIDITDVHGAPVLFNDKPWRDLDASERRDVGGEYGGLFSLVFSQANPQAEARLLGK
jgi:hypothetical protein